jgi:hypothetical protein
VIYVVVPLLDVELGPVLLPLEVDLLQVKEMLVILHIDLFNFLLQHLLLIVFQHFVPLLLHFHKLLRELSLFLGVALDIILEFSNLLFNLCESLRPLLILILGEKELFAEEFER